MPIQAPQWTEYLICPVCENGFDTKSRLPISLGCGHSICHACLSSLQRAICPFDQGEIHFSLTDLPVNTALVSIIDPNANLDQFRSKNRPNEYFLPSMANMEKLATFLKPSRLQLSRPMQRKLVTLINCQLLEEEGRARANRSARSLGERSVTELILQHQNPGQLSANLWASVRSRGCQFLGPAMQEEVLKLVLLALEDGSAFSRKVLVMFVVQRLEVDFPQASKTSIGHVVQLLYRASCFKVTKRDGDSSLMQLKEEFRTYETLRREHDAQIVQIATEAGLRIAPDQWSSLLYGDSTHKSHMQSIIDKLQTPQSFIQSVQELVIALQRTGDPGNLGSLRSDLDFLASMDASPESDCSDWKILDRALASVFKIITGLLAYIDHHQPSGRKHYDTDASNSGLNPTNGTGNRYKTSMCRDLTAHGTCPRGRNCTFAHSQMEIEQYRKSNNRGKYISNLATTTISNGANSIFTARKERLPTMPLENMASIPPVAQVAPLPRGFEQRPVQAQVLLQQQQARFLPSHDEALQQQEMEAFQQEQHHQNEMELSIMAQYQENAIVDGGMPVVIQPPGLDPQTFSVVEEHDSNLQRFPLNKDESLKDFTTPINLPPGIIATKSLSALKSRKDEIIDHLEVLLGKDEASKIQSQACNPPPMPPTTSVVNAAMPPTQMGDGNYSIWTSKALSDFAERNRIRGQKEEQSSLATASNTAPVSMGNPREVNHSYVCENNDVIPFSETPQISRFGPISRKCSSLLPSASPSQTQAVISDEPTPTAVVRHSKQMSRQVPTMAALYHQNGSCTTLQPVAVGVNGEIGYIAIHQDNKMPQGPSNLFQIQQFPLNPALNPNPPSAHLYAESERMKQELNILQRKISDLNLAHIDNISSPSNQVSNENVAKENISAATSGKHDLARELHIIQSTIQDREKEIETNKMRFTQGVNEAEDEKLTISKGMVHHDDSGGRSISTTATSSYTTIR